MDLLDELRLKLSACADVERVIADLRHRYGGAEVYIRSDRPERRQAIQQDLARFSPEEVARRHGVSRETVRRLRIRKAQFLG